MPIRLMIADPDATFIGMLREELLSRHEFQIVGIAQNGEDALHMAQRLRPDELLLSAFLPGLDGISLVREVMRLPHPPVCIMCTCYLPDVLTNAILRSGVFYLLYKPQTPERIVRVLLKCAELNQMPTAPESDDTGFDSLLQALGILPHYSGYHYLERAAALCRREPERIRNLSGWLYQDIAREFDATPEKIERGIRLAIRCAFAAGGMKGVFATRPGNRSVIQYLVGKKA